jgi:hypothetical protein
VGFVLQGMKPAEAQATEWWQGAVLISFQTLFRSVLTDDSGQFLIFIKFGSYMVSSFGFELKSLCLFMYNSTF